MIVTMAIQMNRACELTNLGIGEAMCQKLKRMGVSEAFPVQASLVPHLLTHSLGDVCVSSPTGSGKTLAYAIPIVHILSSSATPGLRALCVLPTRDLALQVKTVFTDLVRGSNLVVASLLDETPELCADIVVTTPGRLIDYLQQSADFSLRKLRFLVIDEADRLLSQSFQDWVPRVLDALETDTAAAATCGAAGELSLSLGCHRSDPLDVHSFPCRKLLFSATLPKNPQKIAMLRLNAPVFFSYGGGADRFAMPDTLKASMVVCSLSQKPLVLLHLLQNNAASGKTLCFASSVEEAHRLYRLLELIGAVTVAEYSSTLPPARRTHILEAFRAGRIQLIVCSDAAARGLDIDDVDTVINYDVPPYVRTYVHRVGRTARAGRTGQTFTLLRHQEVHHFRQLLGKTEGDKVTQLRIKPATLQTLQPVLERALTELRAVVERERQGHQSAAFPLAAPTKSQTDRRTTDDDDNRSAKRVHTS